MTTIAPESLDREGGELVVQVQTVTVVDDATFAQAGELLKTVKLYLGRVAEVFEPMQRSAFEAHRSVVAQRKKVEAHALEAERLLKVQMAAYEREQERLRREAEQARQREQERLEREERARVAEDQRRRQAEAEDERLQRALEAEQRGDTEGAGRLIEAPVVVSAPTPRPVFAAPVAVTAPPRVSGVSFQEQWSFEITDFLALVRAVGEGTQPITLLQPNTTTLGGLARALRGAMNVPGVKAVSTSKVAVRSGR